MKTLLVQHHHLQSVDACNQNPQTVSSKLIGCNLPAKCLDWHYWFTISMVISLNLLSHFSECTRGTAAYLQSLEI